MSARRQILFSVTLVAAAVLVVAGTTLTRAPTDPATDTQHQHGVSAEDAKGAVRLEPTDAARIGITYVTAQRRPIRRSVSTTGVVTFDERRVVSVSARVEGFVERLYVDYTGARVRRGQPLMELHSPMLVAAQEELLLARTLLDAGTAQGSRAADNARELLDAARRRLRYWDVADADIAAIERSGTVRRTLTLRAAADGVVVTKNVLLGMRVMPGMELYRVADLSMVWVEGEVFEKDLGGIALRQPADVAVDAYPGIIHRGTVAFVSPVLTAASRTARVRIELRNPAQRLMPGMYARVGLSLPAAEYLVVPRSAVHFTGERALVFMRHADGTLVAHSISTGMISGDDVVVLHGLTEGDVVVASAGFLVDAESRMGNALSTPHTAH